MRTSTMSALSIAKIQSAPELWLIPTVKNAKRGYVGTDLSRESIIRWLPSLFEHGKVKHAASIDIPLLPVNSSFRS